MAQMILAAPNLTASAGALCFLDRDSIMISSFPPQMAGLARRAYVSPVTPLKGERK